MDYQHVQNYLQFMHSCQINPLGGEASSIKYGVVNQALLRVRTSLNARAFPN